MVQERQESEDTTHTCDAIQPLHSRRGVSQNKTHRRISEGIWYLMGYYGIFGHYLKRYEKT